MRKAIFLFLMLVLLSGACACTKTSSAGEESKKGDNAANYIMDPFILNLSNNGETGALKIAICLELSNPASVEKVKTKTAALRDAIILLISTKTKSDLNSPEGKMQLKDEILLQCNQILKEGTVKNVYFTDFVMQ